MAERLRRMVPFEGYCAHTVDPLSGLLTNAVPEGMVGEKEARFFLEHLYFAEDVNEYNSMALSRRPVALLSETTRGRLERSLRYRELLAPLGFADELRCILTADRELWGAIGVARETGHPGFEPREVNFLRRVAPHLGAGLKAAVPRSQAPPDRDDGVSRGLALDTRGRVSHYTPAAERLPHELTELHSRRHAGRRPT